MTRTDAARSRPEALWCGAMIAGFTAIALSAGCDGGCDFVIDGATNIPVSAPGHVAVTFCADGLCSTGTVAGGEPSAAEARVALGEPIRGAEFSVTRGESDWQYRLRIVNARSIRERVLVLELHDAEGGALILRATFRLDEKEVDSCVGMSFSAGRPSPG